MPLKSSALLAIIGLLFCSCDKQRVFDNYHELGGIWKKDSIVTFALPTIDTTKSYNVFVNLRANNKYPYNNIYLIVTTENSKGKTTVDTLEYMMADPDGNLLGNGFSDIKESKLVFKQNQKFGSGDYKVHIQQANRQTGKIVGIENLEGITEVGLRIENLEK